MVGLSAVSGCVVTDKVEFEERENHPPAFIVDQLGQLQPGQIVYVPRDANALGSTTFRLRVRDQDLDQVLEAHWRMLKYMATEVRGEVNIPPTGTELRDLSIPIDLGELLADNCHRVEVVVSSSFTNDFDPVTGMSFSGVSERFDLATFAFWIWEGEPNDVDFAKLVETCNAQLYQPTVTTAGAAGATAEGAE